MQISVDRRSVIDAKGFQFQNIAFWMTRAAELTPTRGALVTPSSTYTFRELERFSGRAAGALSATGVGPGDRVGAYLGNSREYIDLLFACARVGAILVPLSTRLTPAELEFLCRDAGIKTLVYDGELAESVKAFVPETPIDSFLCVGAGPHPSYDSALDVASTEVHIETVSEDDVLAIFYTSGTTGRPKGAMLTHGNFFWTNVNMVLALDLVRDERSLVVLPMFHVGGWNVNTLGVWLKGGCVYLEPAFDAGRTLDLIESEKITSLMGVPTIYQALAEHPAFPTTDLSSIRISVCGGAPLPIHLLKIFQERGVAFTQGYGLTEAAPNCLLVPPEDAERKAGAAGRPYFFADVRVFDGVDGDIPPGGIGEVVVRGPSVMKGYWRRPAETEEALRGGWLRTGDVGRVDEEGYIYLVDRVKDMFISGGENVYPAEVENVLSAHPDVAEVAVIGAPDERWGEVGRAVIVLRPGAEIDEQALKSYCAERLARFKVPATFVFAESLPRNVTGKLLKAEIREQYGTEA